MRIRVLDLDGSVTAQSRLRRRADVTTHDFSDWGPQLRIHCRLRSFDRFHQDLADRLGSGHDDEPTFTLYGSGDFHHVSLALLRRQPARFNLLVIDKHSDWIRGAPRLHCGTWIYHAGRLPQVEQIFHVGGDVDFDNGFRWLAPWPWIHSGKLVVLPAIRRFHAGQWKRVQAQPLKRAQDDPVDRERLELWLHPHRDELASRPLYISVDKDVLLAEEAVVNWDSGFLTLEDLRTVIDAFGSAAKGRLAAVDTTGDWSPVKVQGAARRFSNWIERPALEVDPSVANERNARVNAALLDMVQSAARTKAGEPSPAVRV